jgi:peroxiredoxin
LAAACRLLLLGGNVPPSVKVKSMRSFFCMLVCTAALLGSGELSGRRAPGFSLPDMNLKQHDLQDYRGKIVLIDVMQTRCAHCATFSTILEEVAAKYKGRVAVLSIVNPPDTTSTVQQYMAQNKVSTPILFDCGQVSSSYYKASPQHSEINVPHLFIVDARGIIQNDYGYSPLTKGIFEDRDLFGELDRMLAKTK